MQTLNVTKINKEATLPTRAHPTDAGLDIYASEDVFIPEGGTAVIPTGISIETPVGYVAKVEDRSSLASKGLRTGAGVVDSAYRGEIKVVMHNLNNTYNSMNMIRGYQVNKGAKIAQILFYRVETPTVKEVQQLDETDRSTKGFGSSDVNNKEKKGIFG